MTSKQTATAKERVLNWVRAANPATMELKFGCRLKYKEHTAQLMHDHRRKDREGKWEYVPKPLGGEVYYEVWDCFYGVTVFPIDETEIIGFDLGLQELLIAAKESEIWLSVTEAGWVARCGIDGRQLFGCIRGWYDLNHNLHSQSPEFYEAILPLIP